MSTGWYVGEPSNFAQTKNGKTHSYYSNPENWQEKAKDITEFVKSMYEIYPVFYENFGSTHWVVQVQAITPEGEPHVYFKFDLWEDEKPLEDQKADFMDWLKQFV